MNLNDNQVDNAELDRLGIVRVMTESFVWGGFRYGNMRDALAAARKGVQK